MRLRLSNVNAIGKVVAAVLVLTSLFGISVAIGTQSSAATTTGQSILSYAASQNGYAYCDGGGTINGATHGVGTPQGGCNGSTVGYDCMSLVQYAVYQGTGKTVAIPNSGSPVIDGGEVITSVSALLPGDAIFFGGPNLAGYVHSGIYAGNGTMWDAFTENAPVQLRTMASIETPKGPYIFDAGVRYASSGPPPPPPPRLGVTTSSLPNGSVYSKTDKVIYSQTLHASKGNPPYRWSLATGSKPLPPGLKLKASGVISGKATTKGVYPFTVKVVDTKTKTKPPTQNTATKSLSITIS
jgi:cell wall-associated NlpC family hydrolase